MSCTRAPLVQFEYIFASPSPETSALVVCRTECFALGACPTAAHAGLWLPTGDAEPNCPNSSSGPTLWRSRANSTPS